MKPSWKFIAMFAISAALSGCDTCSNEVVQTVLSPSGQRKAIVFNRNCGATVGFNTQLSIIPAHDDLPPDSGNTLVLDGTIPLRMKWQSDSDLTVLWSGSAKIFEQQRSVGDVSVTYRD
ncbi:hypothetical protein ACFOLC_15875 [Lysobacter cavernae]|uniref:Lipoprotein n=1 Tax=Lysobacter cavernae TaxID=1685901 RepID=A0ABV7RTK7_9GAMM